MNKMEISTRYRNICFSTPGRYTFPHASCCMLVIEQHRHDQHQNVFAFWLCRRNNDTSPTWISQLYGYVFTFKVGENLCQRTSLEANVHGLARVIANDAFLGTCRKVYVF